MTRNDLYARLETAQALLSDIYEFADTNQLTDLARLMSVADTMIAEAFDEIECGETGAQFAESEMK